MDEVTFWTRVRFSEHRDAGATRAGGRAIRGSRRRRTKFGGFITSVVFAFRRVLRSTLRMATRSCAAHGGPEAEINNIYEESSIDIWPTSDNVCADRPREARRHPPDPTGHGRPDGTGQGREVSKEVRFHRQRLRRLKTLQ